MASGGRQRHRPFGRFLAADVAEVDIVGAVTLEQLLDAAGRGGHVNFAGEERDGLGQALDRDHLDPFDHRGLGGIFGRDDQPAEPAILGRLHGHREASLDGTGESFQGELADDGVLFETIDRELAAAGKHAQRDGEIKRGRLFRQVAGGEVDHHAILGPDEPAVDHRAFDAVSALFDRGVGQPDEDRLGHRGGRDINLDVDRHRFDAQQGEGLQSSQHDAPPPYASHLYNAES